MTQLIWLCMVLGATLLVWVIPAVSQSVWDAEHDEPPPTSTLSAPVRPVAVKPFTFMFYKEYEPNDSMVEFTGRYGFTLLSQYRTAAFDCEVGDTLVVLKVRSMNQGVREEEIHYPQRPFTLLVIISPSLTVPDTAAFKIDMSAGICDYIKQSQLVLVGSPQELPDNYVWIQLMDHESDRARAFLSDIQKQFGEAVTHKVLPEGFYPQLPIPIVEKQAAGRRKMLNTTVSGYLVCLAVDPSRRAEINQFLWERQKAEFQRIVMKER